MDKKSRASVERERAEKARLEAAAFRKRSHAAKKVWEERRRDPDRLYRYAVNALTRYRDSHAPKDYGQYRWAKRALFKLHPDKAEELMTQAAEEADWSIVLAMQFAKLS